MNASISVICYKHKTLSNGEHPLMLRIYKNNKRKLTSLGISVHSQHWDFEKSKPKPNCPNRDLINKIILDKQAEYQKRILELNSEQKEYTVSSLVDNKKDKLTIKTIREFYNLLINEFTKTGKAGNRLIYKNSLNSLSSFANGKLDIPFSDIDCKWLKEYEKWQRNRGNKETTISLQFRTLRSAYNKAIEARAVSNKHYPFNEYRVSKFDTKTQKRAIPKDDIIKIINVNLSNKNMPIQFSQDIFIFSYLMAGINFTDIANLTKENIINDRLIYCRQKTGKQLNIKIQPLARDILQKYGSGKKHYLFPILDNKKHITPIQKQDRIKKSLKQVNKNLKEIAKIVGIKTKLTTYVSRHSFSTTLKNSGVAVSLISEALGHSNLATTQIYLDSFENEQIDSAMDNLL